MENSKKTADHTFSKEDSSCIEAYLLEKLNPDNDSFHCEVLESFPQEYKITLASAISLFLDKPEHDEESEQERIKRIFILFFRDISQNDIYFDSKEKNLKKRKNEIHKATGESRSKLEHILLSGRIGHETAFDYLNNGENQSTKENLKQSLDLLGYEDFSSILLLAGFYHDFLEDFIDNYKNQYKKEIPLDFGILLIKNSLKAFNLQHLEKFIVPITRILTHEKEISSDEYFENIENPDESMFEGYEEALNSDQKKVNQTIAIHTKLMADFPHNLKTEQSLNVLINKFPIYLPGVFKHYPDFYEIHKDRIHSSLKELFKKFGENPTNISAKKVQEKVQTLINN